jgi:hypothetical protein
MIDAYRIGCLIGHTWFHIEYLVRKAFGRPQLGLPPRWVLSKSPPTCSLSGQPIVDPSDVAICPFTGKFVSKAYFDTVMRPFFDWFNDQIQSGKSASDTAQFGFFEATTNSQDK